MSKEKTVKIQSKNQIFNFLTYKTNFKTCVSKYLTKKIRFCIQIRIVVNK